LPLTNTFADNINDSAAFMVDDVADCIEDEMALLPPDGRETQAEALTRSAWKAEVGDREWAC
jgi:hypothetical protein